MTSIVFLTIAVVSLVETLNSALRGRHSGPTAADSAVLNGSGAQQVSICVHVRWSLLGSTLQWYRTKLFGGAPEHTVNVYYMTHSVTYISMHHKLANKISKLKPLKCHQSCHKCHILLPLIFRYKSKFLTCTLAYLTVSLIMSLKWVQSIISSKWNIFIPLKWRYKSKKNCRITFGFGGLKAEKWAISFLKKFLDWYTLIYFNFFTTEIWYFLIFRYTVHCPMSIIIWLISDQLNWLILW